MTSELSPFTLGEATGDRYRNHDQHSSRPEIYITPVSVFEGSNAVRELLLRSSPHQVVDKAVHYPSDRQERERSIFSVVTGTHYGTKTPPDQQPTTLCAGV